MYDKTNPQTPVSYTNKDFQTIYPELLEMAKKLSYIWDPTISNESDPGVVLLKLGAIIGDKNSYNIDKNILENFPETCTQPVAARSQYRQLGYKMPWYRGATVPVNFRWVGDALENGQYFKIPKYTMIVTGDNSTIYTTTQEVTIGVTATSKLEATVPAIQGTLTVFKAAGQEVIRLSSLDSKNRLYINDKFIAENGIFITNYYDEYDMRWTQVQNVELVPPGTKCYEFDIDPLSGVPYLQFPDDIRNLIEDGLSVKYILTDGYEGNIAAEELTSFYEDVVVTVHGYASSEEKTLSADSVRIYNASASEGGADPETPEMAYKHYKKFVGTFDTLVTLRDYINAIYNSELVSNVIVSDRNTDVQHSYRIIDKEESSLLGYITYHCQHDTDGLKRFVRIEDEVDALEALERGKLYIWGAGLMLKVTQTKEDFEFNTGFTYYAEFYEDIMDAYDLKLTVLHKCEPVITKWQEYHKSFEVDDSSLTFESIEAHIDSLKSVQHDFQPVSKDLPFMLQNVYPIRLKVVPTYKLNSDEMTAVTNNIRAKLMNMLNSRNCEFGDEPSYDSIYAAIKEADTRIKVVIMDDFIYTTYAVYMDIVEESDGNKKSVFKYVPISDYNSSPNIQVIREYIVDGKDHDKCKTDGESKIKDIAGRIQSKTSRVLANTLFILEIIEGTQIKDIIAYTVRVDSTHNGRLLPEIYSDRIMDIRRQVIAKNMLAGVTPVLNIDAGYNLPVSSTEVDVIETDKISTSLTISPFGENKEQSTDTTLEPPVFNPNIKTAEYTLRDNESIRFLAPSFLTKRTFGGYVKFELISSSPLRGDTRYVYADPNNSEELKTDSGYMGLYTKDASGYHPMVTEKYRKISDIAPTIKLDSYVDNNGSDILFLGSTSEPFPSDMSEYEFRPQFEKNMYYKRTLVSGQPRYELLIDRPSDWNTVGANGKPSYTNYYRLKQYYPGFVPAYKVAEYNSKETYYTKEAVSVIDKTNSANNKPKNISDYPADASEWTSPIYLKTEDYKYFNVVERPEDWASNWYSYFAMSEGSQEFKILEDDNYEKCPRKELLSGYLVKLAGADDSTLADIGTVEDLDTPEEWSKNWYKYVIRKEYFGGAKEDIPLSENPSDPDPVPKFEIFNGVCKRSESKVPIYTLVDNLEEMRKISLDKLFTVEWIYVPVSEKSQANFQDYYVLTNLCDYKVHDDNCFTPVPETMYNLYRRIKYNVSDSEKSVTYVDPYTGGMLSTMTKVITETIAPIQAGKDWDIFDAYRMCNEDDLEVGDDSEYEYYCANSIDNWASTYPDYEIRCWSNSDQEYSNIAYASISAPVPDFNANDVYMQKISGGVIDFIRLVTPPADWHDSYDSYYISDGQMMGVSESSPQCAAWRSGTITLYKIDSTFYLPANTEYQLRNGDRLTIFYRTEDDDEAPYTYESYTHIADKTTKEPFIMKANFNLKANTPSNCIVNPSALTTNTGTIPYSSDENSVFQRIRRQMYDEYDLSGSKQIELRAMNTTTIVAEGEADTENYFSNYYFVTRNKESINNVDRFIMDLKYVGEIGDKYRYRYILEQDEYFFYTDKEVTRYEGLGAGFMIELYVSKKPETNDDIRLTVKAVNDPNDIYLKGIKTFADKCEKLNSGEVIKVTEQQIYNFTGGDTIFIKLGDEFDYKYELATVWEEDAIYAMIDADYHKAELIDDGNGNTYAPVFIENYYYKRTDEDGSYKYEIIEEEPTKAPTWISGKYYKKVENKESFSTYYEYQMLTEKPSDWDTNCTSYYYHDNLGYQSVQMESLWNTDYFENNDIYIRTRETITEHGTLEDWLFHEILSKGHELYKRLSPEYPVLKTGHDYRFKDATISYKAAGDKTFTELPRIYVNDDDYVWSAEAILNIIASPSTPQKIDRRTEQSLQYISIRDELLYPFEGGAVSGGGQVITASVDNNEPLYILPSIELNKIGGYNTDVTYTSLDGEVHNIFVIAYQITKRDCQDFKTVGDTVVVNVPSGVGVENYEPLNTAWKLSYAPDSAYGYLLPIIADRSVTVNIQDSKGNKLGCLEGLNEVLGGHHYFVVKEPGDDTYNTDGLSVHITAANNFSEETAELRLLPVVKFKYRDTSNEDGDILDGRYGVGVQDTLEELRKLDVPGIFNYIHIPDKSSLIRDPLDPVSMFDQNHAFNKVVIPRAGVILEEVSVSDVNKGSEIVFVNNR